MTSKTPLISIVMPVYNAQIYLDKSIESMLRQTLTDFEFIIIDDGSTDRSKRICEKFALRDSRIILISRPNTGIVGALNDGMKLVNAPYIARMDADDISLPTRLEKQFAYMEEHSNCVLLGTSMIHINKYGTNLKTVKKISDPDLALHSILNGTGGTIPHPTAMIRSNVFNQTHQYDPNSQYVEDLELFLRISELGLIANLDEPLLKYRIHSNQITQTKHDQQWQILVKVLLEARKRRSLPDLDLDKLKKEFDSFTSKSSVYMILVATALKENNRSKAIRFAFEGLRVHPLTLDSWRHLYWSLT